VILFSEESYLMDDMSNVLICGESSKMPYTPNEYIMAYYTGSHYVLITYYGNGVLDFLQIPYDVKLLIVNKCMEKLAGPYYDIPAFRLFREKLGITDDDKDDEGDIESDMDGGSMDDKTVLQFYSNSSNKSAPGHGSGEKIPKENILQYSKLHNIKNWRRKLDSSWPQTFKLDGRTWKSVAHFHNASKFLKSNPNFYEQFSLESKSPISKDVSKAIIAGNTSSRNSLRPTNVEPDEDYEIEIGTHTSRSENELYRATLAKMEQNKDLADTLLATNNAILKQFRRGKEPIVDEVLMKIRREITPKLVNKNHMK